MSKTAMKLALEALENAQANFGEWWPEAITALREALAEQESGIKQVIELYDSPDQPSQQEPVAFYVYKPTLPRGNLGNVSDGDLPWVYDQDPSSGYSARMLVYTTPPQRTWVGLTDEEVMVAAYQAGFDIHEDYENEDDPEAMHWWTPDGEACDDSLLKLRDLIEAKLKEKNT